MNKTKKLSETVNETGNVHKHLHKSHHLLSAGYDTGIFQKMPYFRNVICFVGRQYCFIILRGDSRVREISPLVTTTDDEPAYYLPW